MERPQPSGSSAFWPDPVFAEWIRQTFLEPEGPLHNPDHLHLLHATLGVLWTNVDQVKQQRTVLATAEIPNFKGSKWQIERQKFQLRQWFGDEPDFLLTFHTSVAEMDDASFCGVNEHELYHCAQALDEYGCLKFTQDGQPKFAIRGHDVEEFVAVVARYGADATNSSVKRLVEAAQSKPTVARARIAASCGTCLRRTAHGG